MRESYLSPLPASAAATHSKSEPKSLFQKILAASPFVPRFCEDPTRYPLAKFFELKILEEVTKKYSVPTPDFIQSEAKDLRNRQQRWRDSIRGRQDVPISHVFKISLGQREGLTSSCPSCARFLQKSSAADRPARCRRCWQWPFPKFTTDGNVCNSVLL